MKLIATRFDTPLGTAIAVSDPANALVELKLLGPRSRAQETPQIAGSAELAWNELAHGALRQQLAEYFAGKRSHFELELAPRGTAFQHSVWRQLRTIPFGTTTSYGALATRLGKPGASRAVGLANGANPIWLVIPCHRVIGANGKLTGYAGGIDVKRRLLEHEGALERTHQDTLDF